VYKCRTCENTFSSNFGELYLCNETSKRQNKTCFRNFILYTVYRGLRVDVSPTDVSLTKSSWMLRPLNKASLGYCAPDRCVPTLDHVRHGAHNAWTAHGMGVASNQYLGMGWFGQGHNSQGTFCPRDATSKNFRSGTHRSGTD
jgi:hypothetical protein